MSKLKRRAAKFTAVILLMSICTLGASGCSKKNEEVIPETAEKTVQATESKLITVGRIQCDPQVQELTVQDAAPAELEELISLLPQLNTLVLEGSIPDQQTLLAIREQYPDLNLIFPVELGGITYSTDITVLDLHGTVVTEEEINAVLPLFGQLQELTITETGLADEDAMALADRYPEILIRCELPLGGHRFLTDSIEIDISGSAVTAEDIDQMISYFPCLKKLDMSFCGISDEEMDALNQRYPDVSIVWTLKIGEAKTRTDAIYFYPAEVNYYPTNEEMKKLRYCHDMIAVDIGHTRATDCEFLWYMPNVRYLILADTGITDITPVGNLKELIYLELFNLNIDDYSPLLNCTKLQDLNIGTTYADPEPLSKMTWLHNLQWHRSDQNPETKEDVLKLPEQLPDTNVVLFPRKKARNIGGPWRYIPNYYVFRDIIGATYFNQDQIADYWGEEDAARIMACESGKSFSAYTLAEIVRERIDSGEPIIGIKDSSSDKAEILYQSLLNAEP